MDKFGENKSLFGENKAPLAGVKKNYAAQVGQAIKKPAIKPVTPAVPAVPVPGEGTPATPAVPASPFATKLTPQAIPGQPPSLSNVAANPRASGQATRQEVAGMSLEQWRNVQRMLGMAPTV
jgi:hypothetical protein